MSKTQITQRKNTEKHDLSYSLAAVYKWVMIVMGFLKGLYHQTGSS